MTQFLQNSGRYRHPITFQQRTKTTNEYGELLNEWSDFTTSRASINPISGKLLISAEAVKSEITHQVHCRYLPNITNGMRIMFGTRVFDIVAVINFQEMNKELQIMCKEYYL